MIYDEISCQFEKSMVENEIINSKLKKGYKLENFE